MDVRSKFGLVLQVTVTGCCIGYKFIDMNPSIHAKLKAMSPQLLVTNLDHSIAFYKDKLGFTIDFRYDDFYAGIVKDGFSIHLKSGNPSVEERKNKRGNADLDIIFSTEDIEELFREISRMSVDVVQPLRKMPYGKEFYIADPDGYILSYISAE